MSDKPRPESFKVPYSEVIPGNALIGSDIRDLAINRILVHKWRWSTASEEEFRNAS